MVLMMLAGLFALLAGRITISRKLSLSGRYARFYGIALLVAAIPTSIVLSVLAAVILPSSALESSTVSLIVSVIGVVAVVVGLAVPFQKWQAREVATASATTI